MKTETKNSSFDIFRQLTNSREGVIDITSSTIGFNLLDGNHNVVFQKTSPEKVSAVNGIIKVEIFASDTINLLYKDYFMEFLVDGSTVLIETIRFKDMLSGTEYLRSGSTANRPSLPASQYVGFNYILRKNDRLDRFVSFNYCISIKQLG